MAKQQDLDWAYMGCALAISELSHANRKKVGAILVAPGGGIIAEGYNGTPSGFENECEHIEYRIRKTNQYIDTQWVLDNCKRDGYGTLLSSNGHVITEETITNRDVLHAESNAIAKVARSTNSSNGATLYVTLSPCFDCAKLIIQCGIKRVVFLETYRLTDGLELLKKANIQVDVIIRPDIIKG